MSWLDRDDDYPKSYYNDLHECAICGEFSTENDGFDVREQICCHCANKLIECPVCGEEVFQYDGNEWDEVAGMCTRCAARRYSALA